MNYESKRKIKKRVVATQMDNICGANLVDTQLISKYKKDEIFLLRVINLYNKYVTKVKNVKKLEKHSKMEMK